MKNISLIHALVVLLGLSISLHADVPNIVNYQGRVAVNGTNFTGTGQFRFAIVNGNGSITFWSNGGGEVPVPVSKGSYSVLLGDTTLTNMASLDTASDPSANGNTDVRLRVWFNDGINGSQLLTPDQRFASVLFAFNASDAQFAAEAQFAWNANMATNAWNAENAHFAQEAQTAQTAQQLDDGTSSVRIGGGYITLDATPKSGPPHDFGISPNGNVSLGHDFYAAGSGNFGGNLEVMGSLLVSTGLTAYGACELGDVHAHAIESQNNITAQGAVFAGYADFNGDVSARSFYATGGFYVQSDRAAKENFIPVNNLAILEKVVGLPISHWNYKQDTTTPHIGPMAQDFYEAFGTGTDERHIATVDADGVALAAIQGLNAVVAAKDARIQDLERRVTEMEAKLNRLTSPTAGDK